jgi:membrane protein DedA with SNARE-associated domain/uncharacterized membrane protein YkvA (DUF1232 family)
MFDWLKSLVSEGGYLGITLLMIAENLFPPIPSELIMPLAGFVAAQGRLHPILVVLAGTAGSVLGALPWYYAGKALGRQRMLHLAARHGRWLTLDENDMEKAINWFEWNRVMAVFIGRLVPAVRTLISVPAGIAHMPIGPFLLASSAGTVIWTGLLTVAGFVLKSEYELVGTYIDGVSKIIVGLIVLTYFYRLMAGGRLGNKVRQWAQGMYRDIYTVYLAARDARVPWYARVWALLAAIYFVSPVDLIPDFIPVVGHLDDAILVPLCIWLAMRLIPEALVEEHRQRANVYAEQPRHWRVGVVFVAIWAIALAFALRWLIEILTAR